MLKYQTKQLGKIHSSQSSALSTKYVSLYGVKKSNKVNNTNGIKVAIYPFTQEEVNTYLNQSANSYVTKDGVNYVILNFVKSIIRSWDLYKTTYFKQLFKHTDDQVSRLRYEDLQIIYTDLQGDEHNIINTNIQNLGDFDEN